MTEIYEDLCPTCENRHCCTVEKDHRQGIKICATYGKGTPVKEFSVNKYTVAPYKKCSECSKEQREICEDITKKVECINNEIGAKTFSECLNAAQRQTFRRSEQSCKNSEQTTPNAIPAASQTDAGPLATAR